MCVGVCLFCVGEGTWLENVCVCVCVCVCICVCVTDVRVYL